MARIRANNTSGGGGFVGSFTPTTSAFAEVEIGFVPTRIFLEGFMSGTYSGAYSVDFDVVNSKIYQSFGTSQNRNDATSSYLNNNMKVEGTKFFMKAPNGSMAQLTYIMAIS